MAKAERDAGIDLGWLAARLREAVREEAMPLFGALGGAQIDSKSAPDDLVSAADLAVETRLTGIIREAMPGALVIGEEAVAEDPALLRRIEDAETSVILDPVDGTWNFVHAVPAWGAILAVCAHGRPTHGLIYDPFGDHVLGAAEGEGLLAWRGGEPVPPPGPSPAREELNGIVSTMLYPGPFRARVSEAAHDLGRVGSYRCSAQDYRLLGRGGIDWVLAGSLKPWDHAAGTVIAREAGGVARMLDGAEYRAGMTRGHLLCAGSEEIWERVAERMRPVLPD